MLQQSPAPVDFPDVEWFVINKDNLDESLKRIEEASGSVAFMAITPKGYENLAVGVAELRRYILQQKEIIAYYEKAIQGDPPPVEAARVSLEVKYQAPASKEGLVALIINLPLQPAIRLSLNTSLFCSAFTSVEVPSI